jgi:hypothetical protein
MAMNVVVTSHLPICLYSAAGVKVNHKVAHTRSTVTHHMVGPPRARNILIISRQRAQGRCFSDLWHSEA